MNEENYFKATSNLSRIRESGLLRFMPRIVCNSCHRSKKQRASRLFIFLSSSKEQGNRTGNPKFACRLFCIPSKTLLCEAADHSSCARWLPVEKSAETEACHSRWSQLLGIRLERTCLCSVRLSVTFRWSVSDWCCLQFLNPESYG